MPSAQTLQLAHRGALLEQVENTLPAFTRALELGADGVELDVRLSADGEVVVFHDEDLSRLAGRPDRIASLTWAQLSAARLVRGARIPRLSDLLAVWPADKWLDVELKPGGERLSQATVAALAGRENTFLSSFDPRMLAHARASGWPHEMALLLERQSPAFLHAEGGREWGAGGVILDAQLCSAAAVSRYHEMGYAVGFFGARDDAHEERLVEMGMRWRITDRPRPPPVSVGA